ncbi:MAG: hypothetical protein GEU83_16810 [Pseudonocardiaceae bacterium]|nr:hypothetical protein [Pseudonocardiaceae bacterium]
MGRWAHGGDEIEALLGRRHLEKVSGARADGAPWLDKATRRVETAEAIVADDPESAFVLAYDAARFVGEALLAHQGLRPTQAGGHLAVTDAVRAQFGGPFAALATLRRRRNELEYPSYPGEHVEAEEAATAIRTARSLLVPAQRLLEHLGLFT